MDQEYCNDGHNHKHCFGSLIWMDCFGMFIHLDFSYKGSAHDRSLFVHSPITKNRHIYFSQNQNVLTDSGFSGWGPIMCPFKKGEALDFIFRAEHNRELRKKRVLNEQGIGYLSKKWRILIGRWPLAIELWEICIEGLVRLSNFLWRTSDSCLKPIELRIEEHKQYDILGENI